MALDDRMWRRFFVAAALFNFAIGVPLMLAPSWGFGLAFVAPVDAAGLAPRLWGDFGFCVALIGVGYLMVSHDLDNRAIVWIGIFAKAFDVIVLTGRWLEGVTRTLVLLPAAIDFAFILGFIAFLVWRKRS